MPAVVGLALMARWLHFRAAGDAPGWNNAVLIYGNIAANLIHGHGYVMTVPPRLMSLAGWAPTIMPASRAWSLAGPPVVVPNAYFMPGYPLLLAGIWRVTATLSYASVQISTLLIDGVTMTLAPWLILRSLGHRWAGIAAAFLCAVAAPLIDLSTRIMPNGLSTDLVLWGLAAAIVLRYRPVRAMVLAGMCLGAALWLQGDMIVAGPLLAAAVLVAAPVAWGERLRAAAVLVAVLALWDAGLSLFLHVVYGGVHLTRPGLGALLGQGLEEQKPYPAHALSGLEQSQHILLRQHHLAWGSWAGDNLLLHGALRTIAHDPVAYAAMALHRGASILTLDIFGLSVPWLLLALLGLAGVWTLSRDRYALMVLVGAWLGRVVPFTLIHVEARYIALLIPLDAMAVVCGAGALYAIFVRFVRLHRARRRALVGAT
jgi:hypothetical protein